MRVGDGSFRDGKIVTDVPKKTKKTDLNRRPEPAQAKAMTTDSPPSPPAEEPSPFAKILHSLGREVDRGEVLMRRATSGASGGAEMGNVELLALQVGVYRYSEAVDLSAKLVDRASNGVKTVLQGQ
jgi:hypothetical protein